MAQESATGGKNGRTVGRIERGDRVASHVLVMLRELDPGDGRERPASNGKLVPR